jgi:hypothetical protein
MATITKAGFSLSTFDPDGQSWLGSGFVAGEAITAGDICYIKSDGKVWKSNGTSANAAAKADGIAMETAAANANGVTLMRGVDFQYATGLTPGARYYVSATAGALDDAATTGGTAPVAFALDATRIRFTGSAY